MAPAQPSPRPTRLPAAARHRRATHWLDQGALGVSLLCLVHCLALPLLIVALPVLGTLVPPQWWVHPLIFAVAAPLATVALVRGWRDHRDRRPGLLGAVGLMLLGLGLLGAVTDAAEVGLTVAGGVVLGAAHLLNWRLSARRCLTP